MKIRENEHAEWNSSGRVDQNQSRNVIVQAERDKHF